LRARAYTFALIAIDERGGEDVFKGFILPNRIRPWLAPGCTMAFMQISHEPGVAAFQPIKESLVLRAFLI
jgi:hypothetical protein